MAATSTTGAARLLTYSEVMRQLQQHYALQARIDGWQAYLDGYPAEFGACFLPGTADVSTILMARNLIMHCRLRFVQNETRHALRFALKAQSVQPDGSVRIRRLCAAAYGQNRAGALS